MNIAGNIRVFCRIRPVIKEDGLGQQAEHIVQLDKDDDGLLSINTKGRTQTFEVDKVFGEESTQERVRIYEPRREKTGLRGFRPGPTQTGLYMLRKELEA